MTSEVIEKQDYSEYFEQANSLAYCLEVLLRSKGWYGDRRSIIESFPHFSKTLTIYQFIKIMHDFMFVPSKRLTVRGHINEKLLPCLFETEGKYYVVLEKNKHGYYLYNGETQTYESKPRLNGRAIEFKKDSAEKESRNFFSRSIASYKGKIAQVFIVSFFINIFSLALPFYVMTVYDRVVLTGSASLLMKLVTGILIVTVGSFALHRFRNGLLGYISSHLDLIISNKIFSKIIRLPSVQIDTASLGVQVSKIKEFDAIREFITGPLMTVLIDLPYTLLFLLVVYWLAGVIVIIPMLSMFILLLAILFCHPWVEKLMQTTSTAVTERQEFILESLDKMMQIRTTGAEPKWRERFRNLSSSAAMISYKASMLTTVVQTLGDGLVTVTALLTIVMGVQGVIENDISIGALIAIMMLVWKILNPIKTLITNLPRLIQMRTNIQHVKSLVGMASEEEFSRYRIFSTHLLGHIVFDKVTQRYVDRSSPVLLNLSFEVKPGQMLVIAGSNGSGKSTIFRLLTKLYLPLAGTILIDGKDVRQINTYELRQSIGMVSQVNDFFYGTITQNLKLANPTASDDDVKTCLKQANLYDEIMHLPEKLNTRLRDNYETSFSASFLQRLAIARALIKKPTILLLDEPMENIDSISEQHILKVIASLKGKVTVLMITHRPSHFSLGDLFIRLHEGQIIERVNVNDKKSKS
ncbi:peptidase domain-containing ABC transporter [Legionella sp. W05-934-2]|jgi:ATP-binding cassette subfamily C protein/ATP-binding cassette subfamily C protein LapB|uniref:peptidase domain-containing ABC transporter n=1 Tax=Legionella sp. W05-934-2 TaxID=1198649 RepID=UPI003462DA10